MQRLQFTCAMSLCVPACWMQCSCPGTALLGTVAVGTTRDALKTNNLAGAGGERGRAEPCPPNRAHPAAHTQHHGSRLKVLGTHHGNQSKFYFGFGFPSASSKRSGFLQVSFSLIPQAPRADVELQTLCCASLV